MRSSTASNSEHRQSVMTNLSVHLLQIKAFVRRTIENRDDDKLVLLDDSAVVCRGLRIVGSTLWTHMPPHALLEAAKAESPEYLVNDYRRIMYSSAPNKPVGAGTSSTPAVKAITASQTNAWHHTGVTAIEREAAAAAAAGQCLLVLTHHAPSFRGTSQPPPPPCDDT